MSMYVINNGSCEVIDKNLFSESFDGEFFFQPLNPYYSLTLSGKYNQNLPPIYKKRVDLWDFLKFEKGDEFSAVIISPNELFFSIFGEEMCRDFVVEMIYKKPKD